MRLSLNQFTAPELPFDAFLDLAGGFGFRSVSPWYASLDAFGLEAGMRRIQELAMAVCCANAVGGFDLRRPESWSEQWEADRAVVGAAARMGAHCLLITTGPAIGLHYEEAQSRVLDALAPTLEHAVEVARPGLVLERELPRLFDGARRPRRCGTEGHHGEPQRKARAWLLAFQIGSQENTSCERSRG